MLPRLVVVLALFAHAPSPAQAPARVPRTEADVQQVLRSAAASAAAGRDEAERARLLVLVRQDPDDVRARLALATLDRLAHRGDAARDAYHVLAARGGSPVVRAYARLGLGQLLLQQTRYGSADSALASAERALAAAGAPAGRATALAARGMALSRSGPLKPAMDAHALALRVAPRDDAWLRAGLVCTALQVRARLSDSTVPARADAAIAAARGIGHRAAEATCLTALGVFQLGRWESGRALDAFARAAALRDSLHDVAGLAAVRYHQGVTHAGRGQFERSHRALREAIALARQAQARAVVGWASAQLADNALRMGDHAGAGVAARNALAAFDSTMDVAGLATTRRHEGNVALANGAYAEARAAFASIVRDARVLPPGMVVAAHQRLAATGMAEGDWVEAERALDRAARGAARLRLQGSQMLDAYARGVLALLRGRPAEAERRLAALYQRVPPDWSVVRAEVLSRLAEAHVALGRHDEAITELARAAALEESVRALYVERGLRAAVGQTRRYDHDEDLGFATAIAGLARSGRATQALELVERRRAQQLLLALRRGRDARATAAPASIAAVRGDIPESTAVVAYLTGRGREPTTVFVLTRDTLLTVAAPPIDDHAQELERFAGLLASGTMPRALARRLGDAFVAPALAVLPPDTRRLVLVPDGALHRLAFDALTPGGDAPLVARFAVSLAPSASVAALWWRRPPRPPRPRLVAFGDPAGVRIATDGADSIPPRLPMAAREAREIARYATRAEVLTGADATESRIRRLAPDDIGVLHFATHADVEDWSLVRSSLLLAPGGGEDGRLGAEELLRLGIDADVVVLSACRSGGGAVLEGEGLQGLTSPLLEAGARSVVATLWQVGDRSVAPMTALLYRELARGARVDDALARAKREAIARGLPPSVWAAFTLSGDPRTRTALRERPDIPWAVPIAALVLGVGAMGAWTSRRRASA